MNAICSTKITIWLPPDSTSWNWQVLQHDQARRIRLTGTAPDRKDALQQAFHAVEMVDPLTQPGGGDAI